MVTSFSPCMIIFSCISLASPAPSAGRHQPAEPMANSRDMPLVQLAAAHGRMPQMRRDVLDLFLVALQIERLHRSGPPQLAGVNVSYSSLPELHEVGVEDNVGVQNLPGHRVHAAGPHGKAGLAVIQRKVL